MHGVGTEKAELNLRPRQFNGSVHTAKGYYFLLEGTANIKAHLLTMFIYFLLSFLFYFK